MPDVGGLFLDTLTALNPGVPRERETVFRKTTIYDFNRPPWLELGERLEPLPRACIGSRDVWTQQGVCCAHPGLPGTVLEPVHIDRALGYQEWGVQGEGGVSGS